MGVKPRVAHRSSDKAERAKAAGHDAVVLDFAKPETLRPALDGVDAVFLLGLAAPGRSKRRSGSSRRRGSPG